jgi:hypothetical protein
MHISSDGWQSAGSTAGMWNDVAGLIKVPAGALSLSSLNLLSKNCSDKNRKFNHHLKFYLEFHVF